MANKYLRNLAGKIVELEALVSTVGVADAGKIVATGTDGKLDISLMPAGVGAEVSVVATSENLSAGDFVNFHNSSGIKARKADASSNAKWAVGFVLAGVTSPANATVYGISNKNTALTGRTVAVEQWLSTTPGGVTETAPSGSGQLVQRLGCAESATEMVFSNQSYYELA